LILRWFWWRVNAWSEIAAMLAPYIVYPILKYYNVAYEVILMVIVAWSTLVWIIVTLLTRPTDESKLISFYTRIHPGGKGWRRIAQKLPEVKSDRGFGYLLMNWVAGCGLVLFSLFGLGQLIFGYNMAAILYFAAALLCGVLIYRNMSKIGWQSVTD
jgi:hypothetical protein